jgi:hypothetical protein
MLLSEQTGSLATRIDKQIRNVDLIIYKHL